jgi:hypothetical protein
MVSLGLSRWLIALVLCLSACGGGGNGTPTDAGAGGAKGSGGAGGHGGATVQGGTGGAGGAAATGFVGSWHFSAGTIMPMCGSIAVADIMLAGGTATITKTDNNRLMFAFDNGGLTCNVAFTSSGMTASIATGQTCTLKDASSGISATVAITTWDLNLSGDTITMSMKGTAKVVIVNCTPMGTGTLTRSGP